MALILYRFLLIALWPLVLTLLLQQARKRAGGWQFVRQRLGVFTAFSRCKLPTSESQSARIWLHAASVGEVMAVQPIIEHILERQAVLITVNTPEALRLVYTKFPEAISKGDLRCCYSPFDFPYAWRRFFNSVSVSKLFVVETELWPNLYKACADRQIGIVIINGRLSAKTTGANAFIRSLYGDCLKHVSSIWAKSETDAQSFIELGAESSRVEVLGNIKFATRHLETRSGSLPVQDFFLALSTHPKEELLLAKAWRKAGVNLPLVIAPRHPVRGAEITAELGAEGFQVARRSLEQLPSSLEDIYLADTLGEVPLLLASAKVVLMGGSWVPVGGHNMLEPAAAGCATITGPSLSNFKEESDYLVERGALRIVEEAELPESLSQLINCDAELRNLSANARQAMAEASDVLVRYQVKLDGLLG